MIIQKNFSGRSEEALRIDPTTAEVDWEYGQVMDPYGIDPDLPDELQCVGRIYFARSPGSSVWVCFYDLPEEIREALWERHSRTLAFPAGLPAAPDQEGNLRLVSDEAQ